MFNAWHPLWVGVFVTGCSAVVAFCFASVEGFFGELNRWALCTRFLAGVFLGLAVPFGVVAAIAAWGLR